MIEGRSSLEVDTVVVGAGVCGLAVAAALAQGGSDVLVLEAKSGPGQGISGRSSEVIHAGIYYPTGSLKAQLCVRGAALLHSFCSRHGVESRALGKLILAHTEGEVPELEALFRRALDNGAEGIELLGPERLRSLEPRALGVAALSSPRTGIVDSHGLVKALEGALKGRGGLVCYRSELRQVERAGPGFGLEVRNPQGIEYVRCQTLVNAAGLHADRVAALAGDTRYTLQWAKGDYFSVPRRYVAGISRLLYPLPQARLSGLGIHLTFDLAGSLRLGPDVTYLRDKKEAYDVGLGKGEAFARAAGCLVAGLDSAPLEPAFSGIRPKLQGPDQPSQDFVIEESPVAPGLINLLGIESPGLTAALAIGEVVYELLTGRQ